MPHPITIAGTSASAPEILRAVEIRSGLSLSILDIDSKEDLSFHFKREILRVGFGFVLAGGMRSELRNATTRLDLVHKTGLGGIQFLPEVEGSIEIPARQRLQILHLHIDPCLLHDLLRDELDSLSADFRPVMEGPAGGSYVQQGEMDPVVHSVAYQVLHDRLPGLPQRLFLEGKAFELIARQIAWLALKDRARQCHTIISPSEKERLYYARDIIIENLLAPPTLVELSRRLALSINKLESGFRLLFGTTVYGFLKEHQMQTARLFFEEGGMNISQVAWAVGYVNVSHFCSAFKKRFGVTPKTFLKSVHGNRILC